MFVAYRIQIRGLINAGLGWGYRALIKIFFGYCWVSKVFYVFAGKYHKSLPTFLITWSTALSVFLANKWLSDLTVRVYALTSQASGPQKLMMRSSIRKRLSTFAWKFSLLHWNVACNAKLKPNQGVYMSKTKLWPPEWHLANEHSRAPVSERKCGFLFCPCCFTTLFSFPIHSLSQHPFPNLLENLVTFCFRLSWALKTVDGGDLHKTNQLHFIIRLVLFR